MTTAELVKKLDQCQIDWCVNCALTGVPSWSTKRKMFAYIFVNSVRMMLSGTTYGFFENSINGGIDFMFKPDFLTNWDNVAVGKLKYKKRYYSFLIPILEEHLKNCGDDKIRKFSIAIYTGTIHVHIA